MYLSSYMKLVDTSPTQSGPKIHYQIIVQHSELHI